MMTVVEINMLNELLEVESGLTGWEMDFIEDLDRQRSRTLSERQREKLDQIWVRVME